MVVTRMPTVTGSVTFTVRILRRFRLLFFLLFFPFDLSLGLTATAAGVGDGDAGGRDVAGIGGCRRSHDVLTEGEYGHQTGDLVDLHGLTGSDCTCCSGAGATAA